VIEIKPLHYFLAAYEEGSITAAASRCFIAQPSITHAIKSLEASLGVILFTRSKQGIKPTAQGHKLYKLATDLLLQNQQLAAAFTANNKIELGLFIQADINVEHYFHIIDRLKRASVEIDLSTVDGIEQAQLAIIDEHRLPPQFQFKRLGEEGYQLLVARDHPLANHAEVSLREFEGLNFIERPYCTNRQAFERLVNEQRITICYKGKAIHDLQLQGMVKLGLGVAVIPESYIACDDSLAYIPIALDVPITRSIVLAYRKLPTELKELLV
jgi:LysR family transcriptional regulator, benzoate and cis,cis-muconate-responsive activator of ben and cat genes